MRRMLIRSPAFARDLRNRLKSHPEEAISIQDTLELLSSDAAHSSLHTHKLRGPLAGCRACSLDYDLRVVFEFVEHQGAEAIHLLALGTHDEVY